MSKAHQPGDSRPVRSRLPGSKSVLPDFGDLSESEQVEFLRDVLLTADSTTDHDVLTKVAEFVEEYPERARLPISTALAVAEATAGANRGRNHGRKQAPSNGGLTRPAEPHPTGRHRVRGKAQSRLIDCRRQAKAAVGGSDE